MVENIGTPIKFEEEKHELPLNFKIGGHYDLGIKKLLITPQDKIQITGKIEKGLETEFITGAGIEYGWKEMAFLRVGYQLFGNEDGIKAGCGIKYKNFQIDYAFSPHENLGIVHRIGLVVNIKNKIKKEIYITRLIKTLPEKERQEVEDLFFPGLDRYYRDDPKGAIKLWKKIKTSNKELNKEIGKQIKKVEDEIRE